MNSLAEQWHKLDIKFRKEILKARRRGMNKAVMAIRNKTRSLVKTGLGRTNRNLYNDKIWEGARVSKYKEIESLNEAIAAVHIMGTSKKGSGTYRLRFFENGTKERKTNDYIRTHPKTGRRFKVSGHYIGKIGPKEFFKNAVSETINKAPNIIEAEIKKAIERCNNG